MKTYDFSVVARSPRKLNSDELCDMANELFGAGAEDCTISAKGNSVIISFGRESESYKEAVMSAIKQIKKNTDLLIKSVDAGQFVGLSDAAELSNLTRSALSKFSTGERGDGLFPTPYLRVSGKAPLYDWDEIAEWLETKGLVDTEVVENARFTRWINTALRLRYEDIVAVSHLMSELKEI